MKKFYALTAAACVITLSACATSSVTETSFKADNSPTAVDVMKNGGTYTYVKADGPIYANSSAELAERFVGRHIDELPESVSSTKAVQDGNEVICRTEKRTHTRLRAKKVCAPRKEWDLHKDKAREMLRTKQITRRGGDS